MSNLSLHDEVSPHSLLALCARSRLTTTTQEEVVKLAAGVRDWARVLARAEIHGVAPLLYHHLKLTNFDPPAPVPRQLQSLYVRHRRANEVRLRALAEVLAALGDRDIRPRVLKGPLLIDRVYSDPGLRPMGDLDLLVPVEQAIPAQLLLGDMGFSVRVPHTEHRLLRHHHLSPAVKWIDGVHVVIEIHHNAFSPFVGASLQVQAEAEDGMAFNVNGRRASSFAEEEFLWHLCRHSVSIRHQFRMIWAADIVGFAETFLSTIDWKQVQQRYPFVLSTLSVLHCLAPVPEPVLAASGVTVSRIPRDVGKGYHGWPWERARGWDSLGGRWRFLRRTVSPPEWWLRFSYGTGTGLAGSWLAWGRHGMALVRHGVRLARDACAIKNEPRAGRDDRRY